jgi:hypothetical protein
MRELPAIAPDLGEWARVKVHRDCHVQFEQSLYSAPFTLIGRTLWLRATDVSVSVFEDYGLVAQHLRARAAGTRRTCASTYHLKHRSSSFTTATDAKLGLRR